MKKFLAIVLALVLILSMAACGGKPEPAAPAPAPEVAAPEGDAPVEPELDLENTEYTPEQLAVAEKFAAMTESFQALADTISADENLMSVQELVDTMNNMIDAVNEDDALFADPANLTDEVLQNLEEDIVVGNNFIKEIESMIKNYQGKSIITATVEIVNETGIDIYGLAMSPSNSNEWGGDLLVEPLANGGSGVSEMTFTEESLVWDLLAGDSEGGTLTFMGIDFSEAPVEGAQLVLGVTEGGEYIAYFA